MIAISFLSSVGIMLLLLLYELRCLLISGKSKYNNDGKQDKNNKMMFREAATPMTQRFPTSRIMLTGNYTDFPYNYYCLGFLYNNY